MGSYGRNLEFRVPPISEYRMARFATNATPLTGSGAAGTGSSMANQLGLIPLGAPVVADTTAGTDSLGRQVVKLAPQASAPTGISGLALFEYGPAAFAGYDPELTTWSDLGVCPPGRSIQVVHGDHVKVVFSNTVAELFLGTRQYAGRTMVNGLGATPSVAIGDYLVPGAGDDTDGYWQSQTSATGGWLVITAVDTVRVQVEARMLF